MNRRTVHDRVRGVLAASAKLLFGVAVFATTVGAYTYLADTARMHMPLPDEKKSAGRCTIWLVGSSSIYRWKSAAADLDGWQVRNRGIEGARLPELQQRLDLTTEMGLPSAIIFYAGENDLADGVGAPVVLDHLEHLATTLMRRAPSAKLFIVSMKPSPTRWANRPAQLAVDEGLRRFVRRGANIELIEAGDLLLSGGKPGDFYREDGIHLSPAGYARWGGEIERRMNARMRDRSDHCAVR